mmetsp:Transcript_43322/g.113861  ORF Transcript_43322/g.113861 Transcript_43322/m.113861 type:complete len:232 (+) Transcript_43322:290-985(+)
MLEHVPAAERLQYPQPAARVTTRLHLVAVFRAPLRVRREGEDVSCCIVEVVTLEELKDLFLVPVVRDAPNVTASGVLGLDVGTLLDECLHHVDVAFPCGHMNRCKTFVGLQVDVDAAYLDKLVSELCQLVLNAEVQSCVSQLVLRIDVSACSKRSIDWAHSGVAEGSDRLEQIVVWRTFLVGLWRVVVNFASIAPLACVHGVALLVIRVGIVALAAHGFRRSCKAGQAYAI